MNIKLEDIIHFYIGQKCMMTKPAYYAVHELGLSKDIPFTLTGRICDYFMVKGAIAKIQPVLRKLSSMTPDEMNECGNLDYDFSNDPDLNRWNSSDFDCQLTPNQFQWLLSRGFDLFGLIPAGLAIDATKNEQS